MHVETEVSKQSKHAGGGECLEPITARLITSPAVISAPLQLHYSSPAVAAHPVIGRPKIDYASPS